LEKVEIFGLPITTGTFSEMLEQIQSRILQKKKTFVVTANATIVVTAIESQNIGGSFRAPIWSYQTVLALSWR